MISNDHIAINTDSTDNSTDNATQKDIFLSQKNTFDQPKTILTAVFSPGNKQFFNFSHSLFSLFESIYYVYSIYTNIANSTAKQLQLKYKFVTFDWQILNSSIFFTFSLFLSISELFIMLSKIFKIVIIVSVMYLLPTTEQVPINNFKNSATKNSGISLDLARKK